MKTLKQRFEEMHIPEPNSGCWLWIGANNGRYGTIKNNGKTALAHRVSWELHNGQVPEIECSDFRGTCVLHFCDNMICVNPAHLFLGTHKDNIQDKVNKGRCSSTAIKGESHGSAKLNDNAVRQIRKYHAAGGCTQNWLAQVYGVNPQTISKVVNNKSWTHI